MKRLFVLGAILHISSLFVNVNACPESCTCPEPTNQEAITDKQPIPIQVICKNIHEDKLPIFEAETIDIDLSNNHLKWIKLESFKNLEKLKVFKLDKNELTEIPDELLSKCLLESLSVSHNKLTDVAFLRNQTNLFRLDLSFNQIEELPEEIFSAFTNLYMLYLEGNRITNPWPAFQGLPKLYQVLLNDNPLNSLDMDVIGSLPNLRKFYVSNCNISEVDFSKSLQLVTLDISKNPLKVLKDNTFAGLTGLKDLSLNNTGLTSLPKGGFQGLRNLTSLLLNNNPFKTLENSNWNGLPKLHELDLSNADLKFIQAGLFNKLKSLNRLFLEGNHIFNISDGALTALEKLDYLDLSDNNLTTFSHKALAHNAKLRRLVLLRNPLKCSCDLEVTIEWARSNIQVTEGECTHPPPIVGQPWIDSMDMLECS